jgi:cytochrome c oxidase subunit 3
MLSLILFGVTSGFIIIFRSGVMPYLVLLTLLLGFYWGSDIISERSYLGIHIEGVSNSLLMSMKMFIFSEVMFFVRFFWSLYYTIYCGEGMVGIVFPPLRVEVLDPYRIPLLNTVLLLSSRVTVTWGHHSLGSGEYSAAANGIFLSILLRVIFLVCQFVEYNNAVFSISDGVFGSNFFALTGFHRFHVTVGTIGLVLCWSRFYNADLLGGKGIRHDCFIWYWHFVDVVWLRLFLIVYINVIYIS